MSEPRGSSELSRLRAVTYTVAPASPNPSAMPLPTPRLAPVTTATFPSSAPTAATISNLIALSSATASRHARAYRVVVGRTPRAHGAQLRARDRDRAARPGVHRTRGLGS